MYFVYLLECRDGTYYIGTTNDVERRVIAHNTSVRGAKYTRSRRPVILKYTESYMSKSEALKREFILKKLTRLEKTALLRLNPGPSITREQLIK